jgi:hypothetical protein
MKSWVWFKRMTREEDPLETDNAGVPRPVVAAVAEVDAAAVMVAAVVVVAETVTVMDTVKRTTTMAVPRPLHREEVDPARIAAVQVDQCGVAMLPRRNKSN